MRVSIEGPETLMDEDSVKTSVYLLIYSASSDIHKVRVSSRWEEGWRHKGSFPTPQMVQLHPLPNIIQSWKVILFKLQSPVKIKSQNSDWLFNK